MSTEKTRAQDRWDEKAGIVPKTYKINKNTAEEFKQTCSRLNLGQGPVISKLMREFIEQNK